MLFILLCMVCVASAAPIPRSYLRSMKRLEDERLDGIMIREGVKLVQTAIFESASRGLTQFITPPIEGCETYVQQRLFTDVGRCESIIKGVRDRIRADFPDCDILYDGKQYTIKWD